MNDQARYANLMAEIRAIRDVLEVPQMSERTYIAVAAMQAIISNPTTPTNSTFDAIAEKSVLMADALITKLEKEKQ